MPEKKICKYCGQEIPSGSIFCMYCGERVARKKREKQAQRSYPKPKILADGSLSAQVMVDGRRETVKASDQREYQAKIDALRAHVIEMKEHPDHRSLKMILRAYIDKNDGVLSPATIRGYEYILKGRFPAYMAKPICSIDFQQMVNDEAKRLAPKTVENSWGLVSAAFNDAKIPVPEVNLPTVPESDEDFLDYEQIFAFLEATKGDSCELAALLMLHSLRMSELLKLSADDIKGEQILVHGAVVLDKTNKLVEKKTNKNRTSYREVPFLIPRLAELLPEDGHLVTRHPSTIRDHVEKACKKAGLPICSPHDLRRSFATLGYHLGWSERTVMAIGGWNDINTVHRIYIKLSKKDVEQDVQKMRNYYGFTTDDKKPSN